MIKATDYIQTAFSQKDAENLLKVIKPLIEKREKVEIDFTGITIFTTLFFNLALAQFFVSFGPDKYKKFFHVRNLSDVGETTYKHSIENAKMYYDMNQSDREILNDTIKNAELK